MRAGGNLPQVDGQLQGSALFQGGATDVADWEGGVGGRLSERNVSLKGLYNPN